ncbi:MAG: hypothetical protein LC750_07510 [Actinobacteria bacterium]|nr:hypothetical protein [Actinomycetota bacterium]
MTDTPAPPEAPTDAERHESELANQRRDAAQTAADLAHQYPDLDIRVREDLDDPSVRPNVPPVTGVPRTTDADTGRQFEVDSDAVVPESDQAAAQDTPSASEAP